jgi:hypothetical protein
MFSLIKLAIEGAVALCIFYGGVKFGQNYPTLASKLTNLFSWFKSEL